MTCTVFEMEKDIGVALSAQPELENLPRNEYNDIWVATSKLVFALIPFSSVDFECSVTVAWWIESSYHYAAEYIRACLVTNRLNEAKSVLVNMCGMEDSVATWALDHYIEVLK